MPSSSCPPGWSPTRSTEDLSSLLRRIGRLPEDKAVEIARQLCAALAAAHDEGVLHRDLKLANIMLDGRGRVKLTDFGLAAVAEVRAGTPIYMAPEQLAGTAVSVHTDVYSLGLVLHELFTGKRVFEADDLNELSRLHQKPMIPSLTSTSQLDPSIERVIHRCLETDPAKRPMSACREVAQGDTFTLWAPKCNHNGCRRDGGIDCPVSQ